MRNTMSLLSRNHSKETPLVSGTMRAVARQREKYTHDVKMGGHTLVADEPSEQGGLDEGPNPQELLAASLASCTAITIEMYAKRKGWDTSGLEVDCRYSPADRGCVTKFDLVMRMPPHLSEEQVERLRVIAAKCPIHRVLEGEVAFDERVELA
jgi:putative redox protein